MDWKWKPACWLFDQEWSFVSEFTQSTADWCQGEKYLEK